MEITAIPLKQLLKKMGKCITNVDWLIEADWRIYASVNQAIIGSGNDLLHGRCQAITRVNDGILLIVPLGTNFGEILIEK